MIKSNGKKNRLTILSNRLLSKEPDQTFIQDTRQVVIEITSFLHKKQINKTNKKTESCILQTRL